MPIGGILRVGKSPAACGCGLQFSENRTFEQILYESYPIRTSDFLGKWFPSLTGHPTTRPVGPSTTKICYKLQPGDKTEVANNGTKYFREPGDEHDVAIKVLRGEYEEYPESDDCPKDMVPVYWNDPTTRALSCCLKLGVAVYEETSNNFGYLKFGFGAMPWLQDMMTTSMNPTTYSGTGFPFPWNTYDMNIAQSVNLLAYLMWNNIASSSSILC
jgi:hypothetical protein